jgi:hypothetical protein
MASEESLAWTPEAEARLGQVPEGEVREMTRQRVEVLARRLGLSTVTAELVEDKYQQWEKKSPESGGELAWTEEARQRMERVPAFVQGMVVKAIEAYAIKQGATEVTSEMVDEAKGFWGETGRFHEP